MLDQLIYTRCSPARDLKNNGQVMRSDGFGIFSMSPELPASKRIPDFDLLQSELSVFNGASETSPAGLFNSYEYSMIAPDVFAFSYEVARPRCLIPRSNGKGHRAGTHIKQYFIGQIERYPAEWFGASAWDAHLKSENDYYLDDDPGASPPFLPQVSAIPQNGYISPELVRRFVSEGRADAVKAGIWFLLQEFEKDENERKVLLIKDTPENVELWIAAIEYGFPVFMAQKITFTTNRSNLGTQADISLFYYTDNTGRFQRMMNRGIPQTRHPYCMITGYHPKDSHCSSLRQMDTSNFVIIDGTAKSACFQPDDSVRMPYYSAVTRYDADIQNFCNEFLPALPLRNLTGELPELFDAYKYLLDPDHRSDRWEYSDTLHFLNILLQFGASDNPELTNYLLDECLRIYQHFAEEDELRRFPLLNHMRNLAEITGRKLNAARRSTKDDSDRTENVGEHSIKDDSDKMWNTSSRSARESSDRERDVTGCAADIISRRLGNLQSRGKGITGTWQALKESGADTVILPVLRDLLNDTELSALATQFETCGTDSVETVLDMFFQMLSFEGKGISSITESNEKYRFVCLAVIALLDDTPRLTALLKKLNVVPDLFNGISFSVAEYLDRNNPSRSADWWDMIIDMCGSGVSGLCRKLCSSKSANIEMVERLLSNHLEKTGRFDRDSETAFAESIRILGKNPDTGRRLFGTWINISSPDRLGEIIYTVRRYSLDVQTEEELFHLIDEKLPYDAGRKTDPMAYRDMKQWADSLNKISRSVSFYEFKHAFEREKNVENAVNLACSFAGRNFSVDENFLSGSYFMDLVSIAAQFCHPALHVAMLCLFLNKDDNITDHYVDKYVILTLNGTKGYHFADQLVALYTAALYKFELPVRTADFVNDIQRRLDSSLAKRLVNYYKPALVNQILKYPDCDRDVRAKLVTLLEEIGEKTAPKKFGRLFNNLFRKR